MKQPHCTTSPAIRPLYPIEPIEPADFYEEEIEETIFAFGHLFVRREGRWRLVLAP